MAEKKGYALTNGHHADHDPQVKHLVKKQHTSQVLQHLNSMRQAQLFTDAVLVVDHEEFHCHRCVLAASSPYFQAIFSSNFQEAITARVTLHEMSPWIVKRILDFIYTGSLDIHVDNAQDYLRTGHLLQYPDIVQACCDLLCEHLHPTNCLGIKEYASLYGCNRLEQEARNFALDNFAEIICKSEELLELHLDSLIQYLDDELVDIPQEILIWTTIKRWLLHDIENRAKYTHQLLSCVRLSSLSSNELNTLHQDKLLTSQQACLKSLDGFQHSISNGNGEVSGSDEQLKAQGFQKGPRPSTVPRRMSVFFGGQTKHEISDVVAFDLLKKKWCKLPSLPEKLVRASITSSDDTILVTGGIANNVLSNRVWKFSSKEKKWTQEVVMPTARADHSTSILNGFLYITGGLGLDESHAEVPITEIHRYDINSKVWDVAGLCKFPKQQSVLLGSKNTLYELGGRSDGRFTNTMKTYTIDSNSDQLECSCEHYVLPGVKDAGPLSAILFHDDLIYILWKHTGQLISVSTHNSRYSIVLQPRSTSSISCLIVHDDTDGNIAYFIRDRNGYNGSRTIAQLEAFNMSRSEFITYDMPLDCVFHECVSTVM